MASLDGALVVETSDEAKSARFLAALARLARTQIRQRYRDPARRSGRVHRRGSPTSRKPIQLFRQAGSVIVAYGDAAAKDAVNPAEKLGDSPDFTAVKDSLGDYDVSLYVLVKPILDLVDSTSAGGDADWQEREAVPRAAERAGGRHLGRRRRPQVGVQAPS